MCMQCMLLIMKIYITTYIHIWKKHISDFIVIYDKKKEEKKRTLTLEDHFREDQKDWKKKKSQYRDYKTDVNSYIDIYFSTSPSPIKLNTSLSLKSITKQKSQ